MAGQLQVVTGIATTLIALIAGLTLNVERLGRRARRRSRRVTVDNARVAMLGLVRGRVAGLALAADRAGGQRASPSWRWCALLVVIVVSFSPTMTAAVIAETGARGRLSELVLAIVVLADLVLLVLFSLAHAVRARGARRRRAGGRAACSSRLAWEIGGARGVRRAGRRAVRALPALRRRARCTLVLLGVCALLSQVGATQQFEPLLAAMAAGLVIENLAVAQGDALKAAVQRGAPPVLVVFFVGGRRVAAARCARRDRARRRSRWSSCASR